jgi:cytochrome c-type biogenesis protein CcmH
MRKKLLLSLTIIFCATASFALSPEPRLTDETQEQRARNLFLTVRCLVCEGQVIESSNTEFSFEMRQLIRKKISDGDSDEVIKQNLVKQFGDDILNEPTIKHGGFLLWLLPAIFLISAGFVIRRIFDNKSR